METQGEQQEGISRISSWIITSSSSTADKARNGSTAGTARKTVGFRGRAPVSTSVKGPPSLAVPTDRNLSSAIRISKYLNANVRLPPIPTCRGGVSRRWQVRKWARHSGRAAHHNPETSPRDRPAVGPPWLALPWRAEPGVWRRRRHWRGWCFRCLASEATARAVLGGTAGGGRRPTLRAPKGGAHHAAAHDLVRGSWALPCRLASVMGVHFRTCRFLRSSALRKPAGPVAAVQVAFCQNGFFIRRKKRTKFLLIFRIDRWFDTLFINSI